MAQNSGSGMMANNGFDRFRSFAERYLVERATHFEQGKELEQGWQAIMDAKKLYGMIEQASKPDTEPETTQAGVGTTRLPPSNPPGGGSVYGMPPTPKPDGLAQTLGRMVEALHPNTRRTP